MLDLENASVAFVHHIFKKEKNTGCKLIYRETYIQRASAYLPNDFQRI